MRNKDTIQTHLLLSLLLLLLLLLSHFSFLLLILPSALSIQNRGILQLRHTHRSSQVLFSKLETNSYTRSIQLQSRFQSLLRFELNGTTDRQEKPILPIASEPTIIPMNHKEHRNGSTTLEEITETVLLVIERNVLHKATREGKK